MTEILLAPGNLLVRPNQQVTQTEGGIFIEKNAQRRQVIGVVLELGPDLVATDGTKIRPETGKEGYQMRLVPGDMVFYSSRAGLALEKGEDSLYIYLKFNDIIMSWKSVKGAEYVESTTLSAIGDELIALIDEVKFV